MSKSDDRTALQTSQPSSPAATGWWLVDSLGAIVFAGCLSAIIGTWAAGTDTAAAAWLLAGLVLGGAIRAVAQGLAAQAGQVAANHAKHALRQDLIGALLPSRLLRGRLVGEDLRLAIDDVEAQEGMIARFTPLRRAAILSPLLIATVVAAASWFSALILLATLIPFGLGMALAGMAGKSEADRQILALSRLSGLFVDRIASLPVILSFAGEDRITRQIGDAAREVAERTMQILRIAFVSSAMLEFFAALSVALVAVYCGFSLLGLLPFPAPERLNLQEAFFALALAPEFYLGMRRLAAAYHDKQQGEAARRRIDAAFADSTSAGTKAEAVLAGLPTTLACSGLTVEYEAGAPIGPISADWHGPGLHVITGQTGAGKSSLLKGLVGLAPVKAGEVRQDGMATQPAALRSLVGWSGQSPILLPGTLEQNLTLGIQAVATVPEDLIAQCGLGDLIARRGFALAIDPRGSGLSGGERRRIGLIRAILSDRPILLLDEPTADLDPATAAGVIALLRRLSASRLILAATHDQALIAGATSKVTLS
ncbi:ABC transporter ATP-binding protein/permease [Novosphingobium sp.]|uniref:ABC transporter ATP-binding protein/permease n=1 Tax=Novosphingobium sp. TaxID=1874826 RepID=UPI0027361CC4|nr:ATP-binding cassette domain-containing protein [Novosphingobium sp.]MDP3908676.1 ATP-binding cassette domain-containing protein [Novosphingobium sp.]